MKFRLNNSPNLTTADITKLLFNHNFLSDVQFHVAGQIIYAHSLELMKRSIVFEEELFKTIGELKLISITDVNYENVYQFVRFIYTDECKINNSNTIELLKLAIRYKVIKLENEIMRVIDGESMNLNFYKYCLQKNIQLHLRRSELAAINNLCKCLTSNQLLTVDRDVIEFILRSEYTKASELDIFMALVRWITQNSRDNQIELNQQRDHYDDLIRLIRFPVMKPEEVVKCTTKYPHLFKDGDYVSIFKEMTRASNNENNLWNSQKRIQHQLQYEWITMNGQNLETQFCVSRQMLLTGVQFGGDRNNTLARLIITEMNLDMNSATKLTIKCAKRVKWSTHQINLGESIRLQPNLQYRIQIKFDVISRELKVYARKENVVVFTNNTQVNFQLVSRIMLEIYFKLAE